MTIIGTISFLVGAFLDKISCCKIKDASKRDESRSRPHSDTEISRNGDKTVIDLGQNMMTTTTSLVITKILYIFLFIGFTIIG